jgi:hypothetical protein
LQASDLLIAGAVLGIVGAVFLHRRSVLAGEPDAPISPPVPRSEPNAGFSSQSLSRTQRIVAEKIWRASVDAGVNPAFMLALALTESSLNPLAKGDDGLSIGLFQLQLGTARDHRPDTIESDLLTTEENIRLALLEMKRLMRVYPGFSFGDYAEAWTLGGRGRFVRGRRNQTKLVRMHEAISTLDLHLLLEEVPA